MKKITFISLLFFFAVPFVAQATLYNFHLIGEDNSPSNDLGSQLLLEVTGGSATVDFTFMNIGNIDSFIAQVYFDATPDNLLDFGSYVFSYTGDVVFGEGATPGDLPGGNTVSFSSDWDADADNPSPQRGVSNFATGDVGSAESLTISFSYFGSQVFDDVINNINSGSLSIGIHVQGIYPGGESEAYVNTVPEPATMLLFGAGLVGIAGFRMRREQK